MINFNMIQFPECPDLDNRKIHQILAEMKDKPDHVVEVKEDGHRRVFYRDDEGNMHVYGKRHSTVTGNKEDTWDKHSRGKLLADMVKKIPKGWAIDGEVIVPGAPATDIPTYLKNDPDKLQFKAFGILIRDGGVCKWSAKSIRLELQQMGFDTPREWTSECLVTWLFRIMHNSQGLQEFSKWCTDQNQEGIVLKYSSWGPMIKLKARRTYDVVVTGATDAEYGVTGKFAGKIGALIGSQYNSEGKLVEVCKMSGMNDALRDKFTVMREAGTLVGTIVEVEAQERTKTGKLRHPQFVRVRTDKNKEDCKC